MPGPLSSSTKRPLPAWKPCARTRSCLSGRPLPVSGPSLAAALGRRALLATARALTFAPAKAAAATLQICKRSPVAVAVAVEVHPRLPSRGKTAQSPESRLTPHGQRRPLPCNPPYPALLHRVQHGGPGEDVPCHHRPSRHCISTIHARHMPMALAPSRRAGNAPPRVACAAVATTLASREAAPPSSSSAFVESQPSSGDQHPSGFRFSRNQCKHQSKLSTQTVGIFAHCSYTTSTGVGALVLWPAGCI